MLAAAYGVLLLIGAARGADDPLHPLRLAGNDRQALSFRTIASVAQLRHEVQAAAAAHQAVMLDIYADWCTSCKEMQRYTFTDPQVRQRCNRCGCCAPTLRPTTPTIRHCCTSSRSSDRRPLRSTTAQGHEQQRYRVVGYMKAADFAALLKQALTPAAAQSSSQTSS